MGKKKINCRASIHFKGMQGEKATVSNSCLLPEAAERKERSRRENEGKKAI